jgi:hypothetical protein
MQRKVPTLQRAAAWHRGRAATRQSARPEYHRSLCVIVLSASSLLSGTWLLLLLFLLMEINRSFELRGSCYDVVEVIEQRLRQVESPHVRVAERRCRNDIGRD